MPKKWMLSYFPMYMSKDYKGCTRTTTLRSSLNGICRVHTPIKLSGTTPQRKIQKCHAYCMLLLMYTLIKENSNTVSLSYMCWCRKWQNQNQQHWQKMNKGCPHRKWFSAVLIRSGSAPPPPPIAPLHQNARKVSLKVETLSQLYIAAS